MNVVCRMIRCGNYRTHCMPHDARESAKHIILFWIVIGTVFVAPSAMAISCESLSSVSLQNATITLAQTVAAGQFTPPGGRGEGAENAFKDMPAFCRIAIVSKPSSDSDIHIEVWLPSSGWNGNYRAAGNGNWGGSINFGEMATIVRSGFAAAGTDGGHEG